MPVMMPRWLWFVCVVVVPTTAAALLRFATKLHWPSWGWYSASAIVARVCWAFVEIYVELRDSTYETTD